MSDRIVELDYRYDNVCIEKGKIQNEKILIDGKSVPDFCVIDDA